jgi:glycosyltransferase involved in cell wall biosynthesis
MNISVVMAVYNGEQYVEHSINSILEQTYQDFELIVVDDGSTDSTWDILQSFSDSRMKIFRLSPNGGAAKAMNYAVLQSSGKWIAIQDADDWSHPDRLTVQAKYVGDHPKIAVLGTRISCFGDKNISTDHLERAEKLLNRTGRKKMYKERYSICPLCHGTALISKAKFLEAGGYDTSYKITYDYDLWLKLFQLGRIQKIRKVLYHYRLHEESLSHLNGNTTYIEKLRCCVQRLKQFELSQGTQPPRLIVIGNRQVCRIMKNTVAPTCQIHVHSYIHSDIENQAESICKLLERGEIDGIIQLYHRSLETTTRYFLKKGLVMNRNLFSL